MKSFKEKVIYQIYPKSFRDSNGDGVGDIGGIIEKLPYLSDLGIDIIWLSPIFPSPQKDNGYDISDYYGIDPLFGKMEDFQELVKQAKQLNIGIMLDMVLNHTSTEHEWFQKALAGDTTYQDYYILRKSNEEGNLPTNWVSKFGGPAWERFGKTESYYLHLFDKTQADLNWRNPEVRQELYKVVNFWKEKGVQGFRFDVINLIGKDEVLKDDPHGEGKPMYTDRPIVHEYLKELSKATYGTDKSLITVGEMSATSIENCILYTEPSRQELNMAFNFHHLKVDYVGGEKWSQGKFDFVEMRNLFHAWGEGMSKANGWNALFWNNHDQPRALDRFGDRENYPIESCKMLGAAIHLSRGTPYIYQGEEIGMGNPKFTNLSDYQDIESINAYQELIAKGHTDETAIAILQEKSRDNGRTPIPWDQSENAGFTKGTPWLKLNPDAKSVNVETRRGEGSVFAFYQELIRLRKKYTVISQGTYQRFGEEYENLYGYLRNYQGTTLLVLNNFSGTPCKVILPSDMLDGEVLLNNYNRKGLERDLVLDAYETLAILKKNKI